MSAGERPPAEPASRIGPPAVEVADTPARYLRAASGCTVVVAERLHAMVLAAGAGTPFIALEYQPKCRDFTASVDGRTSVKKTFTITPATRATAKRRLTSALADADSAAERGDARRTYRLALRGVRLVMKRFHHEWSGELPR